MLLETDGFDAFMNDIGRMSQAMDANQFTVQWTWCWRQEGHYGK